MKKLLLVCLISLLLPQITFAIDLPFLVQAPTGKWQDKRFLDGCEETSSIIAMAWVNNQSLPTGKKADKLIIDLADWELKKYGSYTDTSASSTADRILKTYFKFKNYKVENNISLSKLKANLTDCSIVLAPMDGRKLKNPNFSHGGPERHMLVIIGYYAKAKEFITNDPGTRRGKNYRYGEKLFYSAMRDYPTGNHEKIIGVKKNVIVINKCLK